MKTYILSILIALTCLAADARPHHGHSGGRTPYRAPVIHSHGYSYSSRHYAPRHHSRSRSFWGRGGRNFWPGFVGGLIGGAISDTVISTPTVVTPTVVTQPQVVVTPAPTVVTPTVVAQPPTVITYPDTPTRVPVIKTPVWVPGYYGDFNGVNIWIPGHYEYR